MIEVCHGLACREAGSEDLMRALEQVSGLQAAYPSFEGRPPLCRQSCFGLCAIGPNVRVLGQFRHGQSPLAAEALLKSARLIS